MHMQHQWVLDSSMLSCCRVSYCQGFPRYECILSSGTGTAARRVGAAGCGADRGGAGGICMAPIGEMHMHRQWGV
jgi:hypothetical protein